MSNSESSTERSDLVMESGVKSLSDTSLLEYEMLSSTVGCLDTAGSLEGGFGRFSCLLLVTVLLLSHGMWRSVPQLRIMNFCQKFTMLHKHKHCQVGGCTWSNSRSQFFNFCPISAGVILGLFRAFSKKKWYKILSKCSWTELWPPKPTQRSLEWIYASQMARMLCLRPE